MKRLIYNTFSIEEGEGLSVFLLIIQSFFIGVFFQSFEISSTALFMENYGKDMIGNAYLLSGLVGILLTALYSRLQRNIRFSTLSILNLLFITITTATLWYGFSVSNDQRLIFVAFLLMGPLFILSFVGFSGMVGRMYTLRQGKRLFSIVDSGLIFGILVISFSIPFILKLVPQTKDLILISAGSIFLSLLIQFMISMKFNLNTKSEETAPTEKKAETRAGLNLFLSNKYVRLTSLFVMLTMVAAFFISYSFLTVTKINYPETKEYAGFLGKFMFAVMVFSFVIKTFIYSRLMKTYGLKVNLMIMPLLLLFFAIFTALSGTLLGHEENTAPFLIFFLLIALVRFFSINLKDSIQTPSIKLLFQPLDKDIRYDIQAKVEGVINELSAVLAGGLLAILALIESITSLHYTYIVTGIIAAWVYVTILLYKEYQNTLRLSLSNFRKKEVTETATAISLPSAEKDTEKVIYSLSLTKKIKPTEYEEQLIQLMRSDNRELRKHALTTIRDSVIFSAREALREMSNKDTDRELRKMAEEVDNQLNKLLIAQQAATEVAVLARSRNRLERERAAKMIGVAGHAQYLPLLKVLLKDIEPNVKIAAFHAAAHESYQELWPLLIDYLESPYYYSAARSALIAIGSPCLELLEKSFFKSGITTETMVLITNIVSQIKHERAIKFLLDKITFPDRKVVLEALHGLSRINYQADSTSIHKILQAIELNIGISAWNLSILLDVKRAGYNNTLTTAMEEELNRSHDLLFMMLSVAYDKASIQHIRENIENGATEAISFAIEMLDLFVDEQLKPTLFPLLEDNKLENKVRELELHFPIYRHNQREVLNQIMNRNSNYLGQYTKACAIYTILEQEEKFIDDTLIANLFNPDPLLKETAAVVMYEIDSNKYHECSLRLHEEIKSQLDKAVLLLSHKRSHLLIEKIFALKGAVQLSKLKNETIIEMAMAAKETELDKGISLLDRERVDKSIYFLLEGEVSLEANGTTVATFFPLELMGDMLVNDTDKDLKLITTSASKFYEIPKKEIYDIMFMDPELITALAQIIDKKFKNEALTAS